jgi:hypothetical protein
MRSLIKVWGVDWWGDGTELAALAEFEEVIEDCSRVVEIHCGVLDAQTDYRVLASWSRHLLAGTSKNGLVPFSSLCSWFYRGRFCGGRCPLPASLTSHWLFVLGCGLNWIV